jgi:hypothetical protein
VVAGADDIGGMHACVGPTWTSHVDGGAPSSDPMSYISLFKKLFQEWALLMLVGPLLL